MANLKKGVESQGKHRAGSWAALTDAGCDVDCVEVSRLMKMVAWLCVVKVGECPEKWAGHIHLAEDAENVRLGY